jgi:hypothetical protein
VHVVRWQGETLSAIASWYTGSWQTWETLAKANPAIDPNRIEIGDRIRIPQTLLKTRKPMPAEFLRPSQEKKTARPAPPPEPPAKPEPTLYMHTVRWKNETLSFIAEWYTDSWQNWEALAEANPHIDPDRIEIGDRIRIPEALLKTRKPLPADFLPKGVSKKAVPPAPSAGKPVEAPEDAELFAPEEAGTQPIVVSEEMELFAPEEVSGNPIGTPEEASLFGPIE